MPFIPLEKKFENFAHLPDQECALIIKDYFLEALKSDLYIDWELVAKFINTPYGGREALCQLFNSALKKNTQKIGNFTIGEWIRKYQDQYLNKERNPNTFFEYVSSNPEIKKLSKSEQLLIARTLRIYDYLLVIPIVDLEGPVESILKFAMRSNTPPEELSVQVSSSFAKKFSPREIVPEHLPLSEALRIYPELGEQLVTASKINLRSFPYPVRPSIKNWLADYTSNLGYEKHESMARSQYLFQGTNAKNLSAPEKNKLAYILKSFDENSLITLNKNTKQVIYPISETNLPKGLTDQFRPATEQKNINALEFSYRQKLPYEKTLSAPAPVKALPREIPAGSRGVERISRGEQNLPRNVVDLKNIQE